MSAAKARYDVYAYGVVASSTLYTLDGSFPSSEGYAEIREAQHMTGGEAANSSIVLARLGLRVRLDGSWIGADENGRRTKALLERFGIDVTRLRLREDYAGVQEVVFVAQDTRTIFGSYAAHLAKEEWNAPQARDVTAASIVCLDPFYGQASLRVAQVASDANVPVVTIDCPADSPLLEHASAVVIAESFLRENYAGLDTAAVFERYLAATRGLVIFTFGAAAPWYARQGDAVKQAPPYVVDSVDTAGGGDSFRAGIVYGLLQAWTDEETIEFAAATAALNCTRTPGVLKAPTYDEVRVFQRRAKRHRG